MVRHALAFTVFTSAAVLLALVCLPLVPFRGARIRASNLYGWTIGPLVMRIAGVSMTVEGQEKLVAQAPAVFVANHSSQVDPWACMSICPMGGVSIAKRAIGYIPIFGQVYWLSGHLLIDRRSPETAVASMRRLAELVQRLGLSIWLWPEGTQSHDGRLLEFKRGFVHLALQTGLPVVPVVFHDAHLHWPARSTTLVPGTFRVQVLDAIDTSDWSEDTVADHAEAVRQAMAAHVGAHQQPAEIHAS